MAGATARINVVLSTAGAMAQLRALQSAIGNTNRTAAMSSGMMATAQRNSNRQMMDAVNATRMWSSQMVQAQSHVDRFGKNLERGKLSMGEYMRYGATQSRLFRRAFQEEFNTIDRLAKSRLKTLQTQYVEAGRAANGARQAIAIRPTDQAMNWGSAATQAGLAAQRAQIYNKIMRDGSTAMLNWGKNTQWAGRQLMVGFSIPLAVAGGIAAKSFIELDKAGTQFKRVYGDLSTPTGEAEKNMEAVKALGLEYTKYGVSVAQTMDVAAKAAATGLQGNQLLAATEQTLRLASLGQIDYNQALEATITLQSAFGIKSKDLGDTINFLNAAENQSILSLDDITKAIPRVAPVIKGLGGDVQDLAVMMTALREGGVTAEQGANALKSGLGSLINPTDRASKQLKSYGLNVDKIVQANKGDLLGTVMAFGKALSKLPKFERQQSLEALFGKYQYARMGALFKNMTRNGSQAQRVMELAALSVEDLGGIADKELGAISDSISVKFEAAVERLKVAIAPVGGIFLETLTPVIDLVTSIFNAFNELPDSFKTIAVAMTAAFGGIAPIVLMSVGLIGNALANVLKGITMVRRQVGRLRGRPSGYQSQEELEDMAMAASLDGKMNAATNAAKLHESAIDALIAAYGRLGAAAQQSAAAMQNAHNRGLGGPGAVGPAPTPGSPSSPGTPGGAVRLIPVAESAATRPQAWGVAGRFGLDENGKALYHKAHISKDIGVDEATVQKALDMYNADPKVANKPGRDDLRFFGNATVMLPAAINQALRDEFPNTNPTGSTLGRVIGDTGAAYSSPLLSAMAGSMSKSPEDLIANDPRFAQFGAMFAAQSAQRALALGDTKINDTMWGAESRMLAQAALAQAYGGAIPDDIQRAFTDTFNTPTTVALKGQSGYGSRRQIPGATSYKYKNNTEMGELGDLIAAAPGAEDAVNTLAHASAGTLARETNSADRAALEAASARRTAAEAEKGEAERRVEQARKNKERALERFNQEESSMRQQQEVRRKLDLIDKAGDEYTRLSLLADLNDPKKYPEMFGLRGRGPTSANEEGAPYSKEKDLEKLVREYAPQTSIQEDLDRIANLENLYSEYEQSVAELSNAETELADRTEALSEARTQESDAAATEARRQQADETDEDYLARRRAEIDSIAEQETARRNEAAVTRERAAALQEQVDNWRDTSGQPGGAPSQLTDRIQSEIDSANAAEEAANALAEARSTLEEELAGETESVEERRRQAESSDEEIQRRQREQQDADEQVAERRRQEIEATEDENRRMSRRNRLSNTAVGTGLAMNVASMGMAFGNDTMQNFAAPTMMLGSMMDMFGIFPGLLNPITAGLAIAALAAGSFAVSLKVMSDDLNEARESAVQTADGMSNVGESFRQTAAFFDKRTAVERLAARQDTIFASTNNVNAKDYGKATQYLASDAGKAFSNEITSVLADVGTGKTVSVASAKIAQMAYSGLISPKYAKALALNLGKSLGSEQMGINISAKVTELLGENGEDLRKDPIKVAIKLADQQKSLAELATSAATDMTDSLNPYDFTFPGRLENDNAEAAIRAASLAESYSINSLASLQELSAATELRYDSMIMNEKDAGKQMELRIRKQQSLDLLNKRQLETEQQYTDLLGERQQEAGVESLINAGQTLEQQGLNALLRNGEFDLGKTISSLGTMVKTGFDWAMNSDNAVVRGLMDWTPWGRGAQFAMNQEPVQDAISTPEQTLYKNSKELLGAKVSDIIGGETGAAIRAQLESWRDAAGGTRDEMSAQMMLDISTGKVTGDAAQMLTLLTTKTFGKTGKSVVDVAFELGDVRGGSQRALQLFSMMQAKKGTKAKKVANLAADIEQTGTIDQKKDMGVLLDNWDSLQKQPKRLQRVIEYVKKGADPKELEDLVGMWNRLSNLPPKLKKDVQVSLGDTQKADLEKTLDSAIGKGGKFSKKLTQKLKLDVNMDDWNKISEKTKQRRIIRAFLKVNVSDLAAAERRLDGLKDKISSLNEGIELIQNVPGMENVTGAMQESLGELEVKVGSIQSSTVNVTGTTVLPLASLAGSAIQVGGAVTLGSAVYTGARDLGNFQGSLTLSLLNLGGLVADARSRAQSAYSEARAANEHQNRKPPPDEETPTQTPNRGGWIGLNSGNWVPGGSDGPNKDSVPALLTPGEFVVTRDQAQKHRELLEDINAGRNGYNTGGRVHLAVGGAAAANKPKGKPMPGVMEVIMEEIAKSMTNPNAIGRFQRLLGKGMAPRIAAIVAEAGKKVWDKLADAFKKGGKNLTATINAIEKRLSKRLKAEQFLAGVTAIQDFIRNSKRDARAFRLTRGSGPNSFAGRFGGTTLTASAAEAIGTDGVLALNEQIGDKPTQREGETDKEFKARKRRWRKRAKGRINNINEAAQTADQTAERTEALANVTQSLNLDEINSYQSLSTMKGADGGLAFSPQVLNQAQALGISYKDLAIYAEKSGKTLEDVANEITAAAQAQKELEANSAALENIGSAINNIDLSAFTQLSKNPVFSADTLSMAQSLGMSFDDMQRYMAQTGMTAEELAAKISEQFTAQESMNNAIEDATAAREKEAAALENVRNILAGVETKAFQNMSNLFDMETLRRAQELGMTFEELQTNFNKGGANQAAAASLAAQINAEYDAQQAMNAALEKQQEQQEKIRSTVKSIVDLLAAAKAETQAAGDLKGMGISADALSNARALGISYADLKVYIDDAVKSGRTIAEVTAEIDAQAVATETMNKQIQAYDNVVGGLKQQKIETDAFKNLKDTLGATFTPEVLQMAQELGMSFEDIDNLIKSEARTAPQLAADITAQVAATEAMNKALEEQQKIKSAIETVTDALAGKETNAFKNLQGSGFSTEALSNAQKLGLSFEDLKRYADASGKSVGEIMAGINEQSAAIDAMNEKLQKQQEIEASIKNIKEKANIGGANSDLAALKAAQDAGISANLIARANAAGVSLQDIGNYLIQSGGAANDLSANLEAAWANAEKLRIATMSTSDVIEQYLSAQSTIASSYQQQAEAQERINFLTKNNPENLSVEQVQARIALLEEEIRLKERDIQNQQVIVDGLQHANDLIAHESELLQRSVDKTNEAYDEQFKALDLIAQKEQQISNLKQGQLSLADALSRGDIAAAAQARNDLTSSYAQYATDSMRTALETQRDASTYAARMRIKAIEEETWQRTQQIYSINQSIYAKEQEIAAVQRGKLQTYQDMITAMDLAVATKYPAEIGQANLLGAQMAINSRHYTTMRTEAEASAAQAQKELLDRGAIPASVVAQQTATKDLADEIKNNLMAELTAEQLAMSGLSAELDSQYTKIDALATPYRNLQSIAEALVEAARKEYDIRLKTAALPAVGSGAAPAASPAPAPAPEPAPAPAPEPAPAPAAPPAEAPWPLEIIRQSLTEWNGSRAVMIGSGIPLNGWVEYYQDGPRSARWYENGRRTDRRWSGFNTGGLIPGFGNKDTVPSMLTPGEFVVRKESAKKFSSVLDQINNGYLDISSANMPRYSIGSTPSISTQSASSAGVYNEYSVSVILNGSNLSADDVARTVMSKIQQAENMQIRSYRY